MLRPTLPASIAYSLNTFMNQLLLPFGLSNSCSLFVVQLVSTKATFWNKSTSRRPRPSSRRGRTQFSKKWESLYWPWFCWASSLGKVQACTPTTSLTSSVRLETLTRTETLTDSTGDRQSRRKPRESKLNWYTTTTRKQIIMWLNWENWQHYVFTISGRWRSASDPGEQLESQVESGTGFRSVGHQWRLPSHSPQGTSCLG